MNNCTCTTSVNFSHFFFLKVVKSLGLGFFIIYYFSMNLKKKKLRPAVFYSDYQCLPTDLPYLHLHLFLLEIFPFSKTVIFCNAWASFVGDSFHLWIDIIFVFWCSRMDKDEGTCLPSVTLLLLVFLDNYKNIEKHQTWQRIFHWYWVSLETYLWASETGQSSLDVYSVCSYVGWRQEGEITWLCSFHFAISTFPLLNWSTLNSISCLKIT